MTEQELLDKIARVCFEADVRNTAFGFKWGFYPNQKIYLAYARQIHAIFKEAGYVKLAE